MSEAATATKVVNEPFEAKVIDKDGVERNQRFNVKIISVSKNQGDQETVERQDPENDNNQDKKDKIKTSNVVPAQDTKNSAWKNIIEAPYDPLGLVALEEESNVLRECIDALVINIEGFGHLFRPRKIAEKDREKNKAAIDLEGLKLRGWLDTVCPEVSFTETRKRMRRDLELTGNGYWEIVRDTNERIIEINHIPSHTMRLTKLDPDSTSYEVPVIRPEANYEIDTIEKRKRFRRFVQIDSSGKPIVWFKEFGDPRQINKTNGETDKEVDLVNEATEIIHFKIYSARSVYGIPRYIGRYVSIIGSRRAEEVNYFTLSNNYVPSVLIMVENGTLSGDSVNRLTEMIEAQVAADPNYSRIVVLEAESAENESFPGQSKTAKLAIHEFQNQQREQMFTEYDKNNQDKVRQSFRLPPLLVGRADDYTRATARESVRVGDEQIFNPERAVVDHTMNRIMLDQDLRWHFFRSRTPNITDNEVLNKMVVGMEKSGAMTPRRADMIAQDIFEGDLGPLPTGIDLDVPYSLQFAQAQNAQRPPGLTSTEPVDRSDEDWVDRFYTSIEAVH